MFLLQKVKFEKIRKNCFYKLKLFIIIYYCNYISLYIIIYKQFLFFLKEFLFKKCNYLFNYFLYFHYYNIIFLVPNCNFAKQKKIYKIYKHISYIITYIYLHIFLCKKFFTGKFFHKVNKY